MSHFRIWLMLAGIAAGTGACSASPGDPLPDPGDPTDPGQTGPITLESPVGDKMATGRTLQLIATAPASTSLTWTSSNEAVATVGLNGTVTALRGGNTAITASSGALSGQFTLTVVDADLEGMGRLVDDQFLAALINALPVVVSAALRETVSKCRLGITNGHINNLDACLTDARTDLAIATDTGDAPVASTFGLLVDHLTRLLNI